MPPERDLEGQYAGLGQAADGTVGDEQAPPPWVVDEHVAGEAVELGIPRNVLTERLNRLVDEGIMEKRRYQERPERFEYRLTEQGIGLYPVIVTMLEWGNQWLDWETDPPVFLVDRDTGEQVEPVLVDRRTGKELEPRKTKAVYSPGRGIRPEAS